MRTCAGPDPQQVRVTAAFAEAGSEKAFILGGRLLNTAFQHCRLFLQTVRMFVRREGSVFDFLRICRECRAHGLAYRAEALDEFR